MVRILVTGMSGAGKSTVLGELARRGHRTVDTDEDGWVLADATWDEPRMTALLAAADTLVVSGTVENQGRFADRFAHTVLLTAPVEVLLARVATRTNNPYGAAEDQRAEIRRYAAEVEPLLRASADIELDGRRAVTDLADELEALLEPGTPARRAPDTRSLTMSRTCRAPADAAWGALTARREEWWPDMALDPVEGGRLRETWVEDGRAQSAEGIVTRVDPPSLLAFEWRQPEWRHPLSVELRIAESDAGSEVSVTETGFDALDDGARLRDEHREGWAFHLGNLVMAAEAAAHAAR